jgi:nicotinamide mononucleotide (NMN) deamidase PncC
MGENTIADQVAGMLAERELSLGTIECGVGGVVGHRVFDAEDGPLVLSDCLTVDRVEKVIHLLNLPRPQFRKAGDFSAKAARAAARAGRVFLGANLCLAVWAPAPDDEWHTPQPIHVVLATSQGTTDETLQYEGAREGAADWIADRALEMVKRQLAALA